VQTPRSGEGCERGVTFTEIVSPTWIWTQTAIVVFVLAGMIIAITKLA
jgi:hypothetical protein